MAMDDHCVWPQQDLWDRRGRVMKEQRWLGFGGRGLTQTDCESSDQK